MASVYDFNEETEEEEEHHLDAGPRWFSTDGILVYLCSLASNHQEVIDHRVDFKKSPDVFADTKNLSLYMFADIPIPTRLALK